MQMIKDNSNMQLLMENNVNPVRKESRRCKDLLHVGKWLFVDIIGTGNKFHFLKKIEKKLKKKKKSSSSVHFSSTSCPLVRTSIQASVNKRVAQIKGKYLFIHSKRNHR